MMNTNFNFSIVCQSTIFFADLTIDASERLIEFSKTHNNIARFMGLPIALCFSLLDLAQAISTLGEVIIKGIANIFGSPFSEKYKFSKGVKQIFFQLPLNLLRSVIGVPLKIVVQILNLSIRMLVSPTNALESNKIEVESVKKILETMVKDPLFDPEIAPDITTKLVLRDLQNLYI